MQCSNNGSKRFVYICGSRKKQKAFKVEKMTPKKLSIIFRIFK